MTVRLVNNFASLQSQLCQPIGVIDLLLVTYNSALYLNETINSVLRQDYPHWRLLIGDGGSKDNTLEIIQKYALKYPDKICLISFEKYSNPCQYFSALLRKSISDYVMFCDHDDVWLPDKISKTFSVMKQAETEHGSDMPLLVFTDKRVVDEDLHVLSDSSFKYQHLNPQNISFNRLLVQNVPSGCTMMINRSLVDLSLPIPAEAVMHDHWISLVAAAFGHLIYLNEPTMLYRQHNNNYYGASKHGWQYFILRYSQGLEQVRQRFNQNIVQAECFYHRFKGHMSPETEEILRVFINFNALPWLQRRRVLMQYGILKTGIRRNIGMFLTS